MKDNYTFKRGNSGSSPELRDLGDGVKVASINIAVTPRKKGDDGKWEDGETDWFKLNFWNNNAELAVKFIEKGTKIEVYGEDRVSKWTGKDGTKHERSEIRVDSFSIVPVMKKDDIPY